MASTSPAHSTRTTRPSTTSSLASTRSTQPLHLRHHSDDNRHHWSIDVAQSHSFLPSPPYSLSVSYPRSPPPPLPTTRRTARRPITSPSHHPHPSSRPSTSPLPLTSPSPSPSPSHKPPTLLSRQSSSYITHLQRHRLLLSDLLSPLPPPPRPCYLRTPPPKPGKGASRGVGAGEGGGEALSLVDRSMSSVERVWRVVRGSEKEGVRVAKEKREGDRRAKQVRATDDAGAGVAASQGQRRSMMTADDEDDDAAAPSVLSGVPAGFYYAKQFDFFTTVRGQAEAQRRAVAAAAAAQGAQGIEGGPGRMEEAKESMKARDPRLLVARGRRSDWQVDSWWETKRYHDAQAARMNDSPAPPTSALTSTPHRPLPPAPLTGAPPLLVSDSSPPPPSYAPLTPFFLSSREDYTAFLPSVPHHLALNALLRPPPSRSTLERGLLGRWVRTLPLFGEVEGGGGGEELLQVSAVVKKGVGDVVYEEGEIGTCMYVLLEGEVRLERGGQGSQGGERPRTAGAGRAGEAAVSPRRPATALPTVIIPPSPPPSPTPPLHPYCLFGTRRSDSAGGSSGGGVGGVMRPSSSSSVSTTRLRGWARVRAVLRCGRSFQLSDMGRLAEARVRQERAWCSEDSVLLCVSYLDFDRVSRAHRERQSRLTLTSFRAIEGLGRLRSRTLHRLGRWVSHRRVGVGEWVVPPDAAAGAGSLWMVTSGTVRGMVGVEVVSYHRQPTSYKAWEWAEVRARRRVGWRVEVGPCMVGVEALLGVGHYDVGWKATTACEVYELRRGDFHLLMAPPLMEGWRERVERARVEMREAVMSKMQEEERAQAEQLRKKPRRVKVELQLTSEGVAGVGVGEAVSAGESRMRRRSLGMDDAVQRSPALYQEVRGVLHLSTYPTLD